MTPDAKAVKLASCQNRTKAALEACFAHVPEAEAKALADCLYELSEGLNPGKLTTAELAGSLLLELAYGFDTDDFCLPNS